MSTTVGPTLETSEFNALRELVRAQTGVSLSDAKRMLVQSRLSRRLRELNLPTFTAYLHHLEGVQGQGELQNLIGVITTHTTHFWREAHHFELLTKRIIEPAMARGARKLRLWSAASSSGEEVWCMTMTVAEALGAELPRWDVRLLATDIDTNVLETAERGVYDDETLEGPYAATMRKYMLRGVRANAGKLSVKPSLRPLVTFKQLNLTAPGWKPDSLFDAIFLRNVLIYFDAATQLQVVNFLTQFLTDDGVLILGHAESMVGTRAQLKSIGRGVFSRSVQ